MSEKEAFLDTEKRWRSFCRTEGAGAARWSFLSQTGCERPSELRTDCLHETYGAFTACLRQEWRQKLRTPIEQSCMLDRRISALIRVPKSILLDAS